MRWPDFLVIGAMKSGTSALYTYLSQHPEIYMSPVREPNFFAFEPERPSFEAPIDAEGINRTSITDREEYLQLFEGADEHQMAGEASHWYLYWPRAPKRIQKHVPEVQLVAILRNPVERAYSQYLHFVRDGQEPCESFSEALDAEQRRIERNWAMGRYIDRGYYYEQLRRYYDRFRDDQIHVILHQDLREQTRATLSDLYRFLSVDPDFVPDLDIQPNKSGVPENKVIHWLVHPTGRFQQQLIGLLPKWVRRIGRAVRNRNLEKPPLRKEDRERLIHRYRDDIEKLEDLIDRDLSAWLEPVAQDER